MKIKGDIRFLNGVLTGMKYFDAHVIENYRTLSDRINMVFLSNGSYYLIGDQNGANAKILKDLGVPESLDIDEKEINI